MHPRQGGRIEPLPLEPPPRRRGAVRRAQRRARHLPPGQARGRTVRLQLLMAADREGEPPEGHRVQPDRAADHEVRKGEPPLPAVPLTERRGQCHVAPVCDRAETGVPVGEVAELVGQHGPQLRVGETRQEGQAQVEPPLPGQQAQGRPVLGHGGVGVPGQQQHVRRTRPDPPGDARGQLPQRGRLFAGHLHRVRTQGRRPGYRAQPLGHAQEQRDGGRPDDDTAQREVRLAVTGREQEEAQQPQDAEPEPADQHDEPRQQHDRQQRP